MSHIYLRLRYHLKTIKRTIQRLSSIGIIQKDSFKDGRGGWTKYKLISTHIIKYKKGRQK